MPQPPMTKKEQIAMESLPQELPNGCGINEWFKYIDALNEWKKKYPKLYEKLYGDKKLNLALPFT